MGRTSTRYSNIKMYAVEQHILFLSLSLSLSLQGVESPLYISTANGNIEMVQLLVHHHAAIDQPANVSNALYNNYSTTCSLSSSYSVLFTYSLLSCSPQNEYAATPLIIASDVNHIEMARFLVKHGASVNFQNQVFLY